MHAARPDGRCPPPDGWWRSRTPSPDGRDGTVQRLHSDDSLLGLDSGRNFATLEGPRLDRGDLLVMPTDGVYEADHRLHGIWGMSRLLETVVANRTRSAAEIVEAVFSAIRAYTAPLRPSDDCTLIVVKADDEAFSGV